MLPETLLHYRILQPLGSGGMGDVYMAEDTKLGRRVALKVLPRGRAEDPERRQRFEREAKAVAALNHPNIVTIHAVEQAGDVTFLTMELVEGKTLSEIIPKGGLPIDRLLKLAIPLADAVTAAHERGITHRDLKPANIMVAGDGRVKVLDFGLAKLQEVSEKTEATMTKLEPSPLTGEGRIVGTVNYMSPEQAEGKAIDHRSDIFSIGVVLYEMATGERPFKGDTNVSVLSSILRDAPASVTDLNRSLPRDLGRIVKRALVKDPEHRYQTAKDLRNDLEALKEEIDSGVVEAPAAAAAARATAAPMASSRRSGILIAAGALVLVLIAGAIWYSQSGNPSSTSTAAWPFQNIQLTRLTNTGKVAWTAISGDSRYVVHVVVDDAGKQSLWLRQVAAASNVQIVLPDAVRYDGVSFSPDGNFVYYVVYPAAQNFSTVYQVPVLGGPPRKIIDDVDTPLAFSPDGKQFAFIRGYQRLGENALMLAAADGTGERKLVVRKQPLSYALNNVAWSPDGTTLVSIQRGDAQGRFKIVATNASSGAEAPIGERVWSAVDSVAWMPDGKGLVAAAIDETPGAPMQLWYIAFPRGDVRRITNDLNNYAQVSVSADGRTLSVVQGESLAHLWVAPIGDAAHARQITTGTGRTDGASGLSWTRDGRIVYVSNAGGNPDIWIADAAGANPRQLTVDPAADTAPQVTPDGRAIVFESARTGGSIWQMDLDGGNPRPLVTAPAAASAVLSPDSKWVYYTSFVESQRQVWRLPLGGGAPERLTAHWDALNVRDDGIFYHPALVLFGLSPDGAMGLGFYPDPEKRGWRVGVFPMAGGEPKRLDLLIPAVEWMPDGRSLVYLDPTGAVGNVSRLSIAGGPPARLTSFTSDGVFNFALSPDGKQLALSRGSSTSDVVLLKTER